MQKIQENRLKRKKKNQKQGTTPKRKKSNKTIKLKRGKNKDNPKTKRQIALKKHKTN